MEYFKLTAAMHNLGCKVNAYEADAMLEELRHAGIRIVPWEGTAADIYIINTCSVTNIADRKSRQMIHKARSMNPAAVVIAVGCYVQARAAELQADTAVDILVGNQEKGRLLPILSAYWASHPDRVPPSVRLSDANADDQSVHTDLTDVASAARSSGDAVDWTDAPAASSSDAADRTEVSGQEHTALSKAACFVSDIAQPQPYAELWAGEIADQGRAFIKVQDGCNQFCAYCIIPYVRGRIRSRSIEDTVKEVTDFARRGYHEVVLTGIHLSSYGLDFDHANYEYAMNHEIPSEHLLGLIRAVAAVPGIERVRLGSLEPRIITAHFVEALRTIPELCPHFHLSLQSGSDRILMAMNRHYDTAAFRHSVALLRAAWTDVAVTTDVIVGFPGESDADFEDSYRFAEEIGFYELHVFRYSRRQGTAADRMPGQLTDRVKAERSDRLMKLDERQSDAFRRRFLGRTEDVIPEEIVHIEGRPYLRGYNRCYVRYLIPVSDASEGACKIGQIMQVCGQEICGGCVLALVL